jgi:hypothetical protein
VHSDEQPSPFIVLPSSHCSPGSMILARHVLYHLGEQVQFYVRENADDEVNLFRPGLESQRPVRHLHDSFAENLHLTLCVREPE